MKEIKQLHSRSDSYERSLEASLMTARFRFTFRARILRVIPSSIEQESADCDSQPPITITCKTCLMKSSHHRKLGKAGMKSNSKASSRNSKTHALTSSNLAVRAFSAACKVVGLII